MIETLIKYLHFARRIRKNLRVHSLEYNRIDFCDSFLEPSLICRNQYCTPKKYILKVYYIMKVERTDAARQICPHNDKYLLTKTEFVLQRRMSSHAHQKCYFCLIDYILYRLFFASPISKRCSEMVQSISLLHVTSHKK